MNYKQSISWLNNHNRFGIKLGLERITKILEKLGNPEKDYKTIHVAGTNGKGSVCHYISNITQEANYKVGIYTSPHLIDFSERIQINNISISKKQIVEIIQKIKPIIDQLKEEKPTYFEITTAIAFEFFKQKKIDIGVIEVGLGGKYDATNIVKPACSVITNVTLEHQNTLGKTTEEIVCQKAGIIKKETPVITAAENKALKIIKKTAKSKKAPLIIVNKKDWKRKKFSNQKQVFTVKTKNENYEIETKLIGKYQGENIAIAINTVEHLKKQGIKISKKHIENGIKKTFNPGRTEIIQKNPYIIIDGAHNPEAAKKLTQTILNDFKYKKLILIIGILKDKDIKEILEPLVPIADEIIITKTDNKRAAATQLLEKIIKKIDPNKKTTSTKNVKNAVLEGLNISKKEDLILITGSLYTVGESLKELK